MKKKELAKTYQKELGEAERKRKRDKVHRIIVFGIFGVCLCVALLLILISSIISKFTKMEYPPSTLAKEPQTELVTQTYDYLDQVIEVGGYYLCIPTEEVSVSTDELLIMKNSAHTFAFSKAAMSEESTLNKDLPFLINSIGASTYSAELVDQGYINTLKACYITGSAKASGANLYFVSCELFLRDEKLEILITAKNQGNLNLAKEYLDHIVDTVLLKDSGEIAENPEESSEVPSEEAEDKEHHEIVYRPGVTGDVNVNNEPETGEEPKKYGFDRYVPYITESVSFPVKGQDDTYSALHYYYQFHIEHGTTQEEIEAGDCVYFRIEVDFPFEEEECIYYDDADASKKGDCFLLDFYGYVIRPIAIDKSYPHSITYYFECPHGKTDRVDEYALLLTDPKKRVESVLFTTMDAKHCEFSPDYEDPYNNPEWEDQYGWQY